MIGQMLAHYRIDAKLGEGGMGVVYKAFDTHLNRTVAIKALPARAVSDPARRQRFIQEARAASALDHPNIITIYDISEAGGQLYIVMQYVAGKTLRELLARGPLPLQDALRYALQIADGLARAHARGIVHRDLKPANVMVTEEGQVKILDFGLAKLTEPVDGSESSEATISAGPQTEEGALLGTPAYMSPEQAQGRKVDARSDIFSFGSLLYEMVAGRPAFAGDNRLSVLASILRDESEKVTALVPSVPPELEKLISRALRKDLERRWQSIADLRVALTEIKEEVESAIRGSRVQLAVTQRQLLPRPALRRRQKPPKHRWVRMAAVSALVMTIVIVGGTALWLRLTRIRTGPVMGALKPVAFTSFPGQEVEPALSPDGEQVAFVWEGEVGGNFDIYVKPVHGGTRLRLTSDPARDASPTWSPDGQQIAFARHSAGVSGILIVPAGGGPERKLGQSAESWFGLAWTRDGRFLAMPDKSLPQDPSSIFLLSIATGEKRKLTSPPPDYFGDSRPAFSPDGKTLAFTRSRHFWAADIYLLPIADAGTPRGEPRRLTSDQRLIWGLDWTPDSSAIVFSSNRAGSQSLWRIAASGGQPERLPSREDNTYSPSISLQKGLLAYTKAGWDTNIWRIELGSTSRGSLPAQLISSPRADAGPQFSPDGKRIVFGSARSGSWEIWVCDSNGSNPMQLTSFGGPYTGRPRWSPDGQLIAFESRKEGQADIYLISAEGGSPRRLTTEPSEDLVPSWSKDGQWIYFGSNRSGAWQVWRLPVGGGPSVQVTKKGGYEAFQSPDGKLLYYAKFDAPGIWRIPSEGGDETQVLDQPDHGLWALLDRGICFLHLKAKPRPSIKFFSFATQQMLPIPGLPEELSLFTWGEAPGFAVSPDARWILYVQLDHTQSDIMLVENFR